MQFIEGNDRSQSILFLQSFDQLITNDNEVRIIDLFVENIKLEDYYFIIKVTNEGWQVPAGACFYFFSRYWPC